MTPRPTCAGVAGGWLLALATLPAAAQGIVDPTQPPAALWAPPPGAAVAPGPAAPQLQSILISNQPGGRRVAVIDGHTVRPGDRVGGAVVVSITQTAVVLRRGKALQTFKLYDRTKADHADAGKK